MDAIIFDVDGTLAETEEAHRLAFNQTFEAHGLGWEWDHALYRRLLGVAGGRERIRHYVDGWRPELSAEITDDRIAALHRDKTARYLSLIADGKVPFRPGIRRLMDEAEAAGLKLAIATTTSRANVLGLLDAALGADGVSRFAVIGAGEDAPVKKPDPGVYRFVLERLGLEPCRCLAIEDSPLGLRAAAGAGLPVVVTLSAFGEAEGFDGALAVVDHLGEPGAPSRFLRGDPHGKAWVDLDLLRRWHREACGP